MHHYLTDNCAVYGRLANLADLAWVQHDLSMNHAFDCGPRLDPFPARLDHDTL